MLLGTWATSVMTLSGTRTRYEQLLGNFRRLQPTAELYCITPLRTGSEDNPNVQQAVPEDYRQVIRTWEHPRARPTLRASEVPELLENQLISPSQNPYPYPPAGPLGASR